MPNEKSPQGPNVESPDSLAASVDELAELVSDSGILGVDRQDDPAQRERVRQIMGGLDPTLRSGLVQRIASDESINHLKIRAFAERHALTPAEEKLVQSLCAGLSSAQHAEKHHISPNTVRTHLQRVREKVGVKRQAEIIRKALE